MSEFKNKEFLKRISCIVGKRGGKPCIVGSRVTIYDIFSFLASEMTIRQILDDFPYLTEEDIIACFVYVLLNNDVIE